MCAKCEARTNGESRFYHLPKAVCSTALIHLNGPAPLNSHLRFQKEQQERVAEIKRQVMKVRRLGGNLLDCSYSYMRSFRISRYLPPGQCPQVREESDRELADLDLEIQDLTLHVKTQETVRSSPQREELVTGQVLLRENSREGLRRGRIRRSSSSKKGSR